MDVLDTFLFNHNSKSCVGQKKRKLSETLKDSEAEMILMKERIERLENAVKKLNIVVKEKHKVTDRTTRLVMDQTETNTQKDSEDQLNELQTKTRINRDEFYIYLNPREANFQGSNSTTDYLTGTLRNSRTLEVNSRHG